MTQRTRDRVRIGSACAKPRAHRAAQVMEPQVCYSRPPQYPQPRFSRLSHAAILRPDVRWEYPCAGNLFRRRSSSPAASSVSGIAVARLLFAFVAAMCQQRADRSISSHRMRLRFSAAAPSTAREGISPAMWVVRRLPRVKRYQFGFLQEALRLCSGNRSTKRTGFVVASPRRIA